MRATISPLVAPSSGGRLNRTISSEGRELGGGQGR